MDGVVETLYESFKVAELPPGFTISESVNGVVPLVKGHPSLILPEEVAAVEATIKQHLAARRYRVAVKRNQIEIYEQISPNFENLVKELGMAGRLDPDLASRLRFEEERYAHHTPVLRFTLLDPTQRLFGVNRHTWRCT